jgi:anti-anti-sigma regulatory factor
MNARPPIVFFVRGRLDAGDAGRLFARVREMLDRDDTDLVVCDVRGVEDPHVGTVDALARVQMLARRLGRRLELRDASPQLCELLALMGLRDVFVLR